MFEDQKQSTRQGQTDVKTILVVEDDQDIGEALLLALIEESFYHVLIATTAYEALQVTSERKFDLFIIDYYLSESNGIELYDKLHARATKYPCAHH